MQAESDIFLGWTHATGLDGIDRYRSRSRSFTPRSGRTPARPAHHPIRAMRPTVIRAMRSTVPWRSTRRWPATTAAQVLVVPPGGPAEPAGVGSPVLATHAWWPQKEGGQMTSQQPGLAPSSEPSEQDRVHQAGVALRSMGEPNSVRSQFDFWDNSYEGRRLFSEVLGTFFLVL